MPVLGDKEPCRATQRCTGTMEWKKVGVSDAVFCGEDDSAHPEAVPDYEAWVCDTCKAEWKYSS